MPNSRRRIAGLLLLALLPRPAAGSALPDPSPSAADALEAYYRGDPESSLRTYQEILKADPWDLPARRNLVRLLRETGRPGEALGDLELLSLLRPQEERLRLQAAETALQAGKAEQALGYLQTLEAPSAEAGYLAGLALLDQGRITEGHRPWNSRWRGSASGRWPGTGWGLPATSWGSCSGPKRRCARPWPRSPT